MGLGDGWVVAKKEVGVGGGLLHPCMDSIPSHYMLLFSWKFLANIKSKVV
jgi:hypothetical protein